MSNDTPELPDATAARIMNAQVRMHQAWVRIASDEGLNLDEGLYALGLLTAKTLDGLEEHGGVKYEDGAEYIRLVIEKHREQKLGAPPTDDGPKLVLVKGGS